jgi:hypothetical protein
MRILDHNDQWSASAEPSKGQTEGPKVLRLEGLWVERPDQLQLWLGKFY